MRRILFDLLAWIFMKLLTLDAFCEAQIGSFKATESLGLIWALKKMNAHNRRSFISLKTTKTIYILCVYRTYSEPANCCAIPMTICTSNLQKKERKEWIWCPKMSERDKYDFSSAKHLTQRKQSETRKYKKNIIKTKAFTWFGSFSCIVICRMSSVIWRDSG